MIRTLQDWIEYAEEIEQTCYRGEDAFDIPLISRDELIDKIETICNHANERDMRFRNFLLKDLNALSSDNEDKKINGGKK